MRPKYTRFGRWLDDRPILTFVLAIVTGLTFGLTSYNLFFLLKANITLLIDYGTMALLDGALLQLFYLLLNGSISVISAIVFKACEKILVIRFIGY